ncbi:MAG: hypothetical protein PHP01_01945 [Phycisphaerae bacterium]|nr:hypothetical protein [Phycisphaerae bacterium]
MKNFFILYLLFFIFIAGCLSQRKIKQPACPPILSAEQASASLGQYIDSLKPFRANGNCTLKFKDGKKRQNSQSFPVRLWFESREKFCVYGDVGFDPKGICFAVDGECFWAYAKPMGVYITGKKNDRIEDKNGKGFFSPITIMDFLNPLETDCADAAMSGYDNKCSLLLCRDRQGCVRKKVYLDRCDKLARKIEYFNCGRTGSIVVELDGYKKTAEGDFLFPHKLIYKHMQGNNSIDSMEIRLDSLRSWRSRPEQIRALFSRPNPDSFKKNGQQE